MALQADEASAHSNAWKTQWKRVEDLALHRGKAFAELLGQCTQDLKDRLKYDESWATVSESNDPLALIELIEVLVLAQTHNQYPYAAVYDQEFALYRFKQDTLSNQAFYEQFNTKAEVAKAIGATRVHQALTQHVTSDLHPGQKMEDLSSDEQKDVAEEAEERYLAYVLLRQAGAQHQKLRTDLKNGYTTGQDRYPKTRQAMLHLLDQYTKTQVIQEVSDGNSFAQKDGDEGYDREYWKDKKCFNCEKMGHPAHSCNKPLKSRRARGKGKGKPKKQDDDDTRSVSSKSSSRSSKSSSSGKSSEETALLLKTLMKDAKVTQAKVRHTQALMAAQKKLEDVQESSNLSYSDDDDEDESGGGSGGNIDPDDDEGYEDDEDDDDEEPLQVRGSSVSATRPGPRLSSRPRRADGVHPTRGVGHRRVTVAFDDDRVALDASQPGHRPCHQVLVALAALRTPAEGIARARLQTLRVDARQIGGERPLPVAVVGLLQAVVGAEFVGRETEHAAHDLLAEVGAVDPYVGDLVGDLPTQMQILFLAQPSMIRWVMK